jgi:hypothetical protein
MGRDVAKLREADGPIPGKLGVHQEIHAARATRLSSNPRDPGEQLARHGPEVWYSARVETTVQYVTDGRGEKVAVLLPIRDYETLIEDLHDLAAIADRRNESTLPHDAFVAQLREDGILPH